MESTTSVKAQKGDFTMARKHSTRKSRKAGRKGARK